MLKSSSSEKKLVKPLKNCFFGPNLHRQGVIMDHAQDEKKIFFGRNNKNRSSAFRKFLFYQNIICFDWVMNFFLSSVMFSVKKVSFPAKTASSPRVVSTKKFPCVYWKVLCRFDNLGIVIYLMWYRPLLFFWEFYSIIPFMVWL